MNLPAYNDLETALLRAGCPGTAAEAHGTLCGLLTCGAGDQKTSQWIDHILAETERHNALARDAHDMLDELRGQVAAALADAEGGLDLMLPADEEPLEERAAMLGQWCQGFLYGLAMGGLTDTTSAGGDVDEAVTDLTEISRASFAPGDDAEESEAAYAEVVEFVRVAASLVFETLNPVPAGNAPAPSQLQ